MKIAEMIDTQGELGCDVCGRAHLDDYRRSVQSKSFTQRVTFVYRYVTLARADQSWRAQTWLRPRMARDWARGSRRLVHGRAQPQIHDLYGRVRCVRSEGTAVSFVELPCEVALQPHFQLVRLPAIPH